MKKALLTLALAMMALVAGAQAQENNLNNYKWEIGGNFGLQHNHEKDANGGLLESSSYMHIEPFVGYHFNQKFTAGITCGVVYGHLQHTNALGTLMDFERQHGYRVGPYFHYDYWIVSRWKFFLEAEAMFSFFPKFQARDDYAASTTTLPYDVKAHYIDVTIRPGVTFMLSDIVDIDLYFDLFGIYNRHGVEKRLDTGDETSFTQMGMMFDLIDNNITSYCGNITLGVTFKL